MTLKYREVFYTTPDTQVKTNQANLTLKYRGLSYQPTYRSASIERPYQTFVYRGLSYSAGTKGTQSIGGRSSEVSPAFI
ncbi:MAG: DUF4278 domain-containing protein [Cyanobacteria bacterium SID2]|nr:DUF4278 domain-containing protein [Cyanobacteria bacterium SID2]MBP0002798.1 DUF4278 domain-containing protein [Cyanobacteria bacterium SBC]